jgi:hypothetical protein
LDQQQDRYQRYQCPDEGDMRDRVKRERETERERERDGERQRERETEREVTL